MPPHRRQVSPSAPLRQGRRSRQKMWHGLQLDGPCVPTALESLSKNFSEWLFPSNLLKPPQTSSNPLKPPQTPSNSLKPPQNSLNRHVSQRRSHPCALDSVLQAPRPEQPVRQCPLAGRHRQREKWRGGKGRNGSGQKGSCEAVCVS